MTCFSTSLIHYRKNKASFWSLPVLHNMILICPSFHVSRPHHMVQMMGYSRERNISEFPTEFFLFLWQTITESGCKECEELEEKNVKEFLRSFTHIVQMFINTSWLHLILFSISVINKYLPIAHRPRKTASQICCQNIFPSEKMIRILDQMNSYKWRQKNGIE